MVISFSTKVSTVTREKIIPKVYDTILDGNVALLRTMGNSKMWRTGYRLDVPIKYQKSTTGGLVGLGGTLDTSRNDTRVKMQFSPARRHKPVVLDDIEIALNKGDERVLDLVATELNSLAMDLADELGTDFYTATGTGNEFDSILNASDDSTNFSTYGSLSRTTYSSLNGYLATSIGTLAISDLANLSSNTKIGSSAPTLFLADTTSWTAYEGLLTPTVRAGYQATGFPQVTRTGMISSRQALGGEIGFSSLYFRGTPVVEDEKCTSGYMFAVNENYFAFYGVDIPDYERINISDRQIDGPQSVPMSRGFQYTGFLSSTQQPAKIGHIYVIGNFISTNPRMQGNLQGITG